MVLLPIVIQAMCDEGHVTCMPCCHQLTESLLCSRDNFATSPSYGGDRQGSGGGKAIQRDGEIPRKPSWLWVFFFPCALSSPLTNVPDILKTFKSAFLLL